MLVLPSEKNMNKINHHGYKQYGHSVITFLHIFFNTYIIDRPINQTTIGIHSMARSKIIFAYISRYIQDR